MPMRGELTLEQKVEALLTVALEPISAEELADVVESGVDEVSAILDELRREYMGDRRGFQFVELASGWVMQSSPDVAPWVIRFANREVSHRLSSAALETLAIVAYRQPVSRAQIASIRGVNVDGVVRLLEQRGYIEARGRSAGPGQPTLFGTTELFLDRLGLSRLDELPAIEQFMAPVETAQQLANELQQRFDVTEVS